MQRGHIQEMKDIFKDTYYRVYTGCQWLNDYYICDTYEKALQIQLELTSEQSS